MTVLIGNNASGKSNVLEVISAIFAGLSTAELDKLNFEFDLIYEIYDADIRLSRKLNRGKVPLNMGYLSGTPETIRTSDPRLRRPLLYPAELRAHTLKLAFSVWRARLNSIIEMVGVEGFEPPTTWSQTRYATRLRYTPKQEKNYTIKE